MPNATYPRHELNEAFTWADHAGPFRFLTEQQVHQFDERGFILLEGVVPPDVVARVIEAIDPFEAEVESFLQQVEGGKIFIARAGEITFTTHVAQRSRILRDFVSAPMFRDLCFDLIGPDSRLYWDQAVYKKPGTTTPFPWHQDNGYAFVEPQAYLTCWVALTDATQETSFPIVVPGVHRQGTLAHTMTDIGFVCLEDPPETVEVEATAGSIVVFSSLTPHCTGANRSDEVRKAYIVQYAPDGAMVMQTAGGGHTPTRADDPGRQWPLLIDGNAAPGLPTDWP